MKCMDVVTEDMQEVGGRDVFGCGEGGHAGGRREREDEVFGSGGGHAGGRRERR